MTAGLDPAALITIVLATICALAWRIRSIDLNPGRATILAAAILGLIATAALLVWATPDVLAAVRAPNLNGWAGIDRDLYMRAATRWLGGGGFYEPYQLGGPYVIEHGAVLYPPVALVLFVPFLHLPAITWWLVPIVPTVIVIALWRPSPLVWPLMILCLMQFSSEVHLFTGNPVIWLMPAVAWSLVLGWPAVLVLLKPSLFPLALIGWRRRSWWVTLACFALVSLPFLPMWFDWIRAVTNGGGGLLYSILDLPLLLVPVAAWIGRTREPFDPVRDRRTPIVP